APVLALWNQLHIGVSQRLAIERYNTLDGRPRRGRGATSNHEAEQRKRHRISLHGRSTSFPSEIFTNASRITSGAFCGTNRTAPSPIVTWQPFGCRLPGQPQRPTRPTFLRV